MGLNACTELNRTPSFGSTKPPADPEDGDEISCRSFLKASHLESTVCPESFSLNSADTKASKTYSVDNYVIYISLYLLSFPIALQNRTISA